VSDAVKAIISLSQIDETVGEVFNIGGQGEVSILELAQQVIQVCNSTSKITFLDYKDAYAVGYEDMARRVPNISKISNLIGWKPEKNLRDIIEDIFKSNR
jgi:UDP-glucose 4-epimerase